jgi:hypothetical protein
MHNFQQVGATIVVLSLMGVQLDTFAGEKAFKESLTEQERWELRLSVPGWLASVDGTSGINSHVSDADVDFVDLAPHLDMAASLRFELRRGRFGVYGEAAYLSLSDGKELGGLIKKLDVREDQWTADFGLSWRVLGEDRSFLEVIGGVRYTNIYVEAHLQGNDQRIGELSRRLATVPAAAAAVVAREIRQARGRDR